MVEKDIKNSLDNKWFDTFFEISDIEVLDQLREKPSLRLQNKEDFLKGKIRNPNYSYPNIDLEKIDSKITQLREFKDKLIINEPNETVAQAYRWKINEQIASYLLVESAKKGDMKKFKRWTEFIYGKPSEDIFFYTLNSIDNLSHKFISAENPDIRKAAADLKKVLPESKQVLIDYCLPEASIFTKAKGLVNEEFSDLLDLTLNRKAKLNSEDIVQIFGEAIKILEANGWYVVINEENTAISVDEANRKVKIPPNKERPVSKVRSLLVHEIGTHVKRNINGRKSGLELLSFGLDRYEQGEEGIAILREQALKDKIEDFSGIDGHFAIGLAYGLDGYSRDFREVFEILQKYYFLKELIDNKDISEALTKSQDKAWYRAERTFRGTDFKTPGTCFTKDIVYREGNMKVWTLVNKDSDELLKFSIGKYDPTNERHLWILTQLGIGEISNQKHKKSTL